MSRRDHAREIYRQAIVQEAARLERIVYAVGAIPLACLTLADLQWFPAVVLVVALVVAILSYGIWFVNQYHASSWKIYNARANADLLDPMEIDDLERVSKAKSSRDGVEKHSPLADTSARLLMIYLLTSIALATFALFDQHIDDTPWQTPNSFATIIGAALLLLFSASIAVIRLISAFNEGWPSEET